MLGAEMPSSEGSMGNRFVAYYFQQFEARAKSAISAAVKHDDDDRAVAAVLANKELRAAIEKLAIVGRSHANASLAVLAAWRETSLETTLKVGKAHDCREELAVDAVTQEALLLILLHNETWQRHWSPNPDPEVALGHLNDATAHTLLSLVHRRARYWQQEAFQPLSDGRRRVVDMMTAVLGQLSRFRFGEVWRVLTRGLRQHAASKDGALQGKAQREVLGDIGLLGALRLPSDDTAQRCAFLSLAATLSKMTHKNKALKRALCEAVTNALAPLASRTAASVQTAEEAQPLRTLWDAGERWAKKPKYLLAALPMLTALACAAPISSPLHGKADELFASVVRRLQDEKEKDRRARCIYLECLLHLTGRHVLHGAGGGGAAGLIPYYIPPPPNDIRRCPSSPRKPAAADDGDVRASKLLDSAVGVVRTLGRRQPLGSAPSEAARAASMLCVDVATLLCRTRTRAGVELLLSLLPGGAGAGGKEIYNESSLVGLYALLCVASLAQHYRPQGDVDEHGLPQGVPLHWWTLGLPQARGGDGARLRSPFSSFRAPAPSSAALWRADAGTAPVLGGLSAAVRPAVILDTSALCARGVLPPHTLFARLATHADELSERVSAVLAQCEPELCSGSGSSLRKTKTSDGEDASDAARLHVFRIVLLCTVYIPPSSYTASEYCALLLRLAVHPVGELRDTVCKTVLPQLVLQRMPLTPYVLAAFAEQLYRCVDDRELCLGLLQALIVLLKLLCCDADDARSAAPAMPLQDREVSPLGTFRDSPPPADPVTQLEAACLVLLAVPVVDVKGRALAVLYWLVRAARVKNADALGLAGRTAPHLVHVIESHVPRVEAEAAALARDLHTTPCDWSTQLREHRRVTPLGLQGGGDAGLRQPQQAAIPEGLRQEGLPDTVAAVACLCNPLWVYCLGLITEALAVTCPKVPAHACACVSAKFWSVLQAATVDMKGDVSAEDRTAIELCQGYAVVLSAGCESQPTVLAMVFTLLKSAVQDLADASVIAMSIIPLSAVGHALDQLKALDDEATVLSKKDKHRRQAWVLRGHLVKANAKVLRRTKAGYWAGNRRTARLSEWTDQQLDLLLATRMDRLLFADHVAVLRCTADLLDVMAAAATLLHNHAAGAKCTHQIDPAKRKRWLSYCIALSQADVASTTNAAAARAHAVRDDAAVAGADVIATLNSLMKERAKIAASCLLAGPPLVPVDMDWIDRCADGAVSHVLPLRKVAASKPLRPLTYSQIICFIHSLLPAGPSPSFSAWGHTAASRAEPRDKTPPGLALRCMNALLRCNVMCPGLVRASAALTLHCENAVAKLHLCTLANAVLSTSTMLLRCTLPMVCKILAAVVCGIADLDDELRMASWRLLTFVCPQLDVSHYQKTTQGAKQVVCAAAKLLPEAGPVLLTLATERLPSFSPPRRIHFLAALSQWAPYIRVDAPADADELLTLTEAYYESHPMQMENIWRMLGNHQVILTRLQHRCVTYLLSDTADADGAVPPASPSAAATVANPPWELCELVFNLVPERSMDSVLAPLEELLSPHPQYTHRAPTAIVFLCHLMAGTKGDDVVRLLGGLLHALCAVGLNHANVNVCKRSRILLRSLLAFESAPLSPARQKLLHLLYDSEGVAVPVDEGFLKLVVASRMLSTDTRRTLLATALRFIEHGSTGARERACSIFLYSQLADKREDETDFLPLYNGLVLCLRQREGLLAGQLVEALTPTLRVMALRARNLPAVWSVLHVVRCADLPKAVEAAACAIVALCDALPPPDLPVVVKSELLATCTLHQLVRGALSQLFLTPPATGRELLRLLLKVLECMRTWGLPASVYTEYVCTVVACLLPEICMNFSEHAAPGYVTTG